VKPASKAGYTLSSSKKLVTIMIFASGHAANISTVASAPVITGITLSIKIISGLSAKARSTASLPFSASPTTVISGCAER